MADTIREAGVRDRVVRTIAMFLGIAESEVADDKTLVQLDDSHDSLDSVELVMEFEEEFEIEINDEDAEALTKKNVGDIVAWFEGRMGVAA